MANGLAMSMLAQHLTKMIRYSDPIMKLLQLIVSLLQQILDKLTRIEQALIRLSKLIARGLSDDLEEWLTKEQAMQYLGITRSTYYRWVSKGILKPRGGAGEDKFFKADLLALVKERGKRKRMKPLRPPKS